MNKDKHDATIDIDEEIQDFVKDNEKALGQII